MQQAKPILLRLLPPANRDKIKVLPSFIEQDFFEKEVDTMDDFRRVVYQNIAGRMINFDGVISAIYAQKWVCGKHSPFKDIREIGLEHNQYVNTITNEYRLFSTHLSVLVESGTLGGLLVVCGAIL